MFVCDGGLKDKMGVETCVCIFQELNPLNTAGSHFTDID